MSARHNKYPGKKGLLKDPAHVQEHPLLAQSRQFQARQQSSFRQRPMLSQPSSLVNGPIEGSIGHDGHSNGPESPTRRLHHIVHANCKQNPACRSAVRMFQHKLETSENFRLWILFIVGVMVLSLLLNSNAAFLEAKAHNKGGTYHRDATSMQLTRLKEEQEIFEKSSHLHSHLQEPAPDRIPSNDYDSDADAFTNVGVKSEKHMLDTLATLGLLDSKHDSSSVNSVLSVIKDADAALGGNELDPKSNANVLSLSASADKEYPSLRGSELNPAPIDSLPINPVATRQAKATVAYVVTLLDCSEEPAMDGAAVLARSIILNSVANPNSSSKYDYKLYAIVHIDALPLRDAATFAKAGLALSDANNTAATLSTSSVLANATSLCLNRLTQLGYEIIVRDTPVHKQEIKAEGYFKDNLDKNAREYIKLYTYTLTDHQIAVHMDFATMLLHPLDELFDAMLEKPGTESAHDAKKQILFHQTGNNTFPDTIEAYYTRDYTTIQPGQTDVPGLQQGLLVVKPSLEVFDELIGIIKSGNFTRSKGWGNIAKANYLGSMSTKGLLSYYYHYVKGNSNSLELNRCFYNAMADSPKTKGTDGKMLCRDGRSQCQDCRTANIQRVRTVNLSICRKPWKCFYHDVGIAKTFMLCRQFERHWFEIRRDIEDTWQATVEGYKPADRSGTHAEYEFLGNCKSRGENGYIPMIFP